jgi:outer membrane protein TolC
VDRQRASRFKTTSELILGVHKRYYGLVLARESLNTTQNIKESFDTAYELAEERLDKGDPQVTETDALKLRVGLAVVTKNLYTVQRQVRVSKEALREILALDDRVEFDIADQKLETVSFEAQSIGQYLKLAEKNNPDIKQLRAALSAEQAQYEAERSKFYPTLLAIGGVRHGVAPGREDQDNPYLNDEFNFFDAGASLGIRWDLNFFQTDASIREKKVGYLRMKSRLKKVVDGIALKVKEKYHQYIERKNGLEASFEAKKAGRALLFLNLTNFKLGMGSGRDVFDALSLHARVAGDYDIAIFDYNIAVVELLDVIGKLTPQEFSNSR